MRDFKKIGLKKSKKQFFLSKLSDKLKQITLLQIKHFPCNIMIRHDNTMSPQEMQHANKDKYLIFILSVRW
jgi:hypothetical protein